jgi:glycosyltransferase involved in cell wall biosynthesis
MVFYSHPSERNWAIARVESELAEHLAARGHEVIAFCPVTEEVALPPWRGVRLEGVKCVTLPGPRWSIGIELPFRVALRLGPGFDALVLNGEVGAWIPFLAARRFRTVRVLAIHGLIRGVLGYRAGPTFRLRLRDRLLRAVLGAGERLSARASDVVIPGSRRLVTEVHEALGIPLKRIEAIPNGCHPRALRTPELRTAARNELGLSEQDFYAVFLGADARRKGIDVAREAVRRARDAGAPIVLLTVGCSAPSSAQEVGYGWVSERKKWQILTAANVFLFPTRYEAYSLAVREAASIGLPLLTTPQSGVEEGIHGKDLLLFDPQDVDGFARALVRLYREPEWAADLGARGRRLVAAWTFRHQAESWETTLRRWSASPDPIGGLRSEREGPESLRAPDRSSATVFLSGDRVLPVPPPGRTALLGGAPVGAARGESRK